MTLKRFKHLLDVHGADLTRWPPEERRAARLLIAADSRARAAFDDTVALDALLDRYAPEPVSAARVAAALRILPPRVGDWRSAVAELWWDLRALPRVPSMVAVVLAGFLVGFASYNLTQATRVDNDISALLFEPSPSDWLQL